MAKVVRQTKIERIAYAALQSDAAFDRDAVGPAGHAEYVGALAPETCRQGPEDEEVADADAG